MIVISLIQNSITPNPLLHIGDLTYHIKGNPNAANISNRITIEAVNFNNKWATQLQGVYISEHTNKDKIYINSKDKQHLLINYQKMIL